jgi:hypothetical protein
MIICVCLVVSSAYETANSETPRKVRRVIASGISSSYLSSIKIALAAETPDQIASEITAVLNELEQYGLCPSYEDRWQATHSGDYGSSNTCNYGNPNIAKLKEIVSISQHLSDDWQDRIPVEQAREMEAIRQRLEREKIRIGEWIITSGIEIQNPHIRPRR